MAFDIRVIYDERKARRVRIFRSDEGIFSFIEERYSDDPLELSWLPLTAGRSWSICDTVETAIREAQGRVEWLKPDQRECP